MIAPRSRAAASGRIPRRSAVTLVALATLATALALVPAGQPVPRQGGALFPGGSYFNLACGFSHRNNDDPIVFPKQPLRSHNHTYIGNTDVDAWSTPHSLRGGSTTCELDTDSSTYWVPTLYVGRDPVVPFAGIVYYVKLIGERLSPFPADLKIVAGNPNAKKPQPKTVASWSCGGVGSPRRFAAVQRCSEDELLELRVTFPNCWNGTSSDSSNHKRHMAYAKNGRCPSTHPVAVPSLIVVLLYPPVPKTAIPSSGKFAAHADFMNGWDPDTLAGLVSSLNR